MRLLKQIAGDDFCGAAGVFAQQGGGAGGVWRGGSAEHELDVDEDVADVGDDFTVQRAGVGCISRSAVAGRITSHGFVTNCLQGCRFGEALLDGGGPAISRMVGADGDAQGVGSGGEGADVIGGRVPFDGELGFGDADIIRLGAEDAAGGGAIHGRAGVFCAE